MPICTAKAKTTGQRCKANAVTGMTVCRMHGGKTPSGPDLPQFKHGRHSKHLPKAMAEAYAASIGDPDLLNLTSELALLDARLGDQLARLEHVDPYVLKAELADLIGQLGLVAGNEAMVAAVGRKMMEVAQKMIEEHKAWRDARETMELRRKTVETEVRRRTTMAQIMTAEQVMVAIGYIKRVFDELVPEAPKRRLFSERIRVLFAGSSAPRAVEATVKEVT